jgi:hypothetical protein
MVIFKEMHEKRGFDSMREYTELRRMLSEAISNGYVEEIPVGNGGRYWGKQQWYRDKETGEIYRLVEPGDNMRGWWDRIDPEEFVQPSPTVQ